MRARRIKSLLASLTDESATVVAPTLIFRKDFSRVMRAFNMSMPLQARGAATQVLLQANASSLQQA